MKNIESFLITLFIILMVVVFWRVILVVLLLLAILLGWFIYRLRKSTKTFIVGQSESEAETPTTYFASQDVIDVEYQEKEVH